LVLPTLRAQEHQDRQGQEIILETGSAYEELNIVQSTNLISVD